MTISRAANLDYDLADVTPNFTRDGVHNIGGAKLAAIAPRFTGSLSLLGSSFLIYLFLVDHRNKLVKVKNRILFGLCIFDVFFSAAFIFSTAAIPEGTPGVYGAAGNTATCSLQGFFIQLGQGAPIYSAFLSMYFFLVIRYNLSDSTISCCIEPAMHSFAFLYSVMTGFAALFMQLYNSTGTFCWIAPYPFDCVNNDKYDCTRGINAFFYKWWFGGVLIVTVWLLIIIFMSVVAYTVFAQERTMRTRYSLSSSSGARREINQRRGHSRKTAIQAFLYIGVFFITYSPAIVLSILEHFGIVSPYPLLALFPILQPLQGFWNFLIFIQSRFAALKVAQREKSFWWLIWKSLSQPCIKHYLSRSSFRELQKTGRSRNSTRSSNTKIMLEMASASKKSEYKYKINEDSQPSADPLETNASKPRTKGESSINSEASLVRNNSFPPDEVTSDMCGLNVERPDNISITEMQHDDGITAVEPKKKSKIANDYKATLNVDNAFPCDKVLNICDPDVKLLDSNPVTNEQFSPCIRQAEATTELEDEGGNVAVRKHRLVHSRLSLSKPLATSKQNKKNSKENYSRRHSLGRMSLISLGSLDLESLENEVSSVEDDTENALPEYIGDLDVKSFDSNPVTNEQFSSCFHRAEATTELKDAGENVAVKKHRKWHN